jgi:hypothetical protein
MTHRLAVDAAIERWIRALARASWCASTSALLAQVQDYGCPLHGGCTGERRLPGLVGTDDVVRECSELERRVLLLSYWGCVCEASERDGTGQAVETGARGMRSHEVAALLGLTVRQVRSRLDDARAKVAKAIRYDVVKKAIRGAADCGMVGLGEPGRGSAGRGKAGQGEGPNGAT